MNIVIYAGDRKYYSVLHPIAEALKNTKHSFLFYYTKSTQLLFPNCLEHKRYFEYDGQVQDEIPIVSESLQLQLPFIPDILILARERWQPEQLIIQEFTTKWDCKIACVEVSSHVTNNIENRLEMLSRTQYPQNQIDYFFEHSQWAKQRRIDCLDTSYESKTIVVGNTRNFKSKNLHQLREKYNINTDKQQILFWGVINTTRNIALQALRVLVNKTKNTHQIYYKCYPGEPYNDRFQKDFNPFCVDGVTVIYDENDIYGMAEICDTHIAAASSVFNFAFVHDKKLVNLDSICLAEEKMNDINTYILEKNNGVEDSAKFWMGIWNLKSINEFKNMIDLNRINTFKRTNAEFMQSVRKNTIDFDWECSFLTQTKKEYGNLVKYFYDYYFDENSSNRIINFLENEIKRRNF